MKELRSLRRFALRIRLSRLFRLANTPYTHRSLLISTLVAVFIHFVSRESKSVLGFSRRQTIDYHNMSAKIINYNKRLFGPGPVARIPGSGIRGYYARMPPLQGFVYCATHGLILGFVSAFGFKFMMADPDTKAIKQYYEENPPR